MSTNPQDPLIQNTHVRDVLDAIGPIFPAYRHGVLSYVSVLHEERIAILRARLTLDVATSTARHPRLTTPSVRAGQIYIENLDAESVRTCIRNVFQGNSLPPVDDQLLTLLPGTAHSYSAYYERIRAPTYRNTLTAHRLILGGRSRFEIVNSRSAQLERDLHGVGVDSIEELIRLYDLSASDNSAFEIVANAAAGFDEESHIAARHVSLSMSAAGELNPAQLKVIVRNADLNTSQIPIVLGGSQIAWERRGAYLYGRHELDLPSNQLVDCRLLYDDRTQAQIILEDLNALPNERRILINAIDPQLSRIDKLLKNPGKQSQDFEAAVAWLLQLLGFAPVHVGALSGLTDEVDIVAQGSDTEILALECTVATPDDTKLTKLINRVERLRSQYQKLDPANARVNVIPVLVTPSGSEEVASIQARADQHAVVLLCRTEIEHAIQQTKFKPRPDLILQRWRSLALSRLMTGNRID